MESKINLIRTKCEPLKALSGCGEVERGGGFDFAIRKNPCIQAPPHHISQNTISDSKITTESKSVESHTESRKDFCHFTSLGGGIIERRFYLLKKQ